MWRSITTGQWGYKVEGEPSGIYLARVYEQTNPQGQLEYHFETWDPPPTATTSEAIRVSLIKGDWNPGGHSPSLEIAQAVALAVSRLS